MHHSKTASTAVDALALAAHVTWHNRRDALRAYRRPLLIAAPLGIAALVVIGFALHANADTVATLLTQAINFPLVVIVAIGWLVASTVARQRRSARRDARLSWLATLPMATTAFERQARRRVVIQLLLFAVVVIGLLLAVALLVALPTRTANTAAVLIAAACVLGASLGWSLGGREPRSPRLRLLAAGTKRRDAGYALGRWPLRHSRASADIGLHARAIGALLLSLPMGVPAIAALCIIVFGLAAFAAWDLLRGLLTTTMQSAGWLRSLPLRPRSALVALGVPALLGLLIALTLMMLALTPAGIPRSTVIAVVVGGSSIATLAFIAIGYWLHPFGVRR